MLRNRLNSGSIETANRKRAFFSYKRRKGPRYSGKLHTDFSAVRTLSRSTGKRRSTRSLRRVRGRSPAPFCQPKFITLIQHNRTGQRDTVTRRRCEIHLQSGRSSICEAISRRLRRWQPTTSQRRAGRNIRDVPNSGLKRSDHHSRLIRAHSFLRITRRSLRYDSYRLRHTNPMTATDPIFKNGVHADFGASASITCR